jgi:cytochrome c oxidase assembly protein subunit 15
MRRRLPTLSRERYAQVTLVALILLVMIVLTGAAVRLTGSGLGCPTWPTCNGKVVAPFEIHAWIEWGNRLITGFVGIGAMAAGLLAYLRRPFRRDLAILGALLPVGVLAQAILGGFTVRHELAPGFVMAHFGLSMLILIAAVALAWNARHEPGERAGNPDRLAVWGTRALLPLGAVLVFMGTVASAAGPHAGSAATGQVVHRLEWHGIDTMDWAIHMHGRLGTALGVATVLLWFLLRRRGADPAHLRALVLLGLLIAAQGVVGGAQYLLKLPEALVWIHVALATFTWLAVLHAVCRAGRLAPQRAEVAVPDAGPRHAMAGMADHAR